MNRHRHIFSSLVCSSALFGHSPFTNTTTIRTLHQCMWSADYWMYTYSVQSTHACPAIPVRSIWHNVQNAWRPICIQSSHSYMHIYAQHAVNSLTHPRISLNLSLRLPVLLEHKKLTWTIEFPSFCDIVDMSIDSDQNPSIWLVTVVRLQVVYREIFT